MAADLAAEKPEGPPFLGSACEKSFRALRSLWDIKGGEGESVALISFESYCERSANEDNANSEIPRNRIIGLSVSAFTGNPERIIDILFLFHLIIR
jgi:hypothetical protein